MELKSLEVFAKNLGAMMKNYKTKMLERFLVPSVLQVPTLIFHSHTCLDCGEEDWFVL